MSSKVKKKILKLKESSTLVINEKSKELISKGKKEVSTSEMGDAIIACLQK